MMSEVGDLHQAILINSPVPDLQDLIAIDLGDPDGPGAAGLASADHACATTDHHGVPRRQHRLVSPTRLWIPVPTR